MRPERSGAPLLDARPRKSARLERVVTERLGRWLRDSGSFALALRLLRGSALGAAPRAAAERVRVFAEAAGLLLLVELLVVGR